MRISFQCSIDEMRQICQIAERAWQVTVFRDVYRSRAEMMMDLQATNANGCPMDFAALLAGDDSNFAHDIAGIYRHLDRETGKLGGCFSPRFAAQVAA